MNERIKIFTPDDESLKTLGEILSNDTGRKIIKILIENEMYLNEISKKLNITPNLASHHLKKLEDLGLVSIVSKPISRKTKDHNFYKLKKDIFLSVVPEENKLKRIFKEGVKFASIGIVGFISWFYSIPEQKIVINSDESYTDLSEDSDIIISVEPSIELILSILIPICVIFGGLALKNFLEKKKKLVER